jgi:lysophospholipase L1-like esterase
MRSLLARLALPLTASVLVSGLLVAPTPVAASAATGGGDPIDILVLGDSYSAGNGATDDQGVEQTYGPDGCRRSRVNWSEKYAAALRASGHSVRLVNHACSGGVTADITSPRVMDTASKVEATPAGVSTTAQADASLARRDPCNTHAFPNEEFWTYRATSASPAIVAYDCTRNLRPQSQFVNSDVDLVLFTMGGNDAGFSSIVQNCFVPGVRTSSGCKAKVDAARALLPQIRQRLLTDVAAIRAHGLRNDAKMVQLGYPWLQKDNGFTLSDPPGYAAGDEVRALVSQGNAAIKAIVPAVNAGHPGQLTFLTGVPEKFSGHEPDATTPVGNAARWVNQVGDGSAVEVWYHPNRFGHAAYAQLLEAHGTFGAPTHPPIATHGGVNAKLRVKLNRHRVHAGHRVRLRATVALSNGSRPRGRVVVSDATRHHRLASAQLRKSDHGRVTLRLRFRHAGTTIITVVYRDTTAPAVRTTRRIHVTR